MFSSLHGFHVFRQDLIFKKCLKKICCLLINKSPKNDKSYPECFYQQVLSSYNSKYIYIYNINIFAIKLHLMVRSHRRITRLVRQSRHSHHSRKLRNSPV